MHDDDARMLDDAARQLGIDLSKAPGDRDSERAR
jgi:hypothetical protein